MKLWFDEAGPPRRLPTCMPRSAAGLRLLDVLITLLSICVKIVPVSLRVLNYYIWLPLLKAAELILSIVLFTADLAL